MIHILHEVIITDAFRDLFKNQKYEQYVFMIISRSKVIFKGLEFRKIETQHNNEPDFMDQFGCKYDAKLLFNTEQGRIIGDRKYNIKDWFDIVMEECSSYGELVNERDYSGIVETELYKITKEKVESLEPDENGLFFIPYPVSVDVRGSIFLGLCTDFLQAIYNKLVEDKILGDRKIFFIYPSAEEGEYVLRDTNFHREYIAVPELEFFIVFKTSLEIKK